VKAVEEISLRMLSSSAFLYHRNNLKLKDFRVKRGEGFKFDTRIFQTKKGIKAGDKFALLPVAIDVEFTHLLLKDGTLTSVASQVCLVSYGAPQHVLIKEYCRHEVLDTNGLNSRSAVERSTGGVPLARLQGAPSLQQVASQGESTSCS
jgi:hypothetical protein